LFLDGSLVVDRNWNYPNPDTIGPVRTLPLDTGYHRIRINYRQTVPYVASAQVRWSGPGFADEVIPVFSFECPLAEAISLRRLDDRTLGVVGFVEPRGYNGRHVQTARLWAEAGAMVIEADRELVWLAEHNAPGGSSTAIPETWGLWSVVLHAEGEFPRNFTLILETVDDANELCREQKVVSLEDPLWEISIQTVDAPIEGSPDEEGIWRIHGWGSFPPQEQPPQVTLQLSRYRPNEHSVGLPGTWVVIAEQQMLPETWTWLWNFGLVPANQVEAGENLYRVVAMLPGEGVEGLSGFYATARANDLMVEAGGEEDLQPRQALVFRDTVRNVLTNAEEYNAAYPQALIVAIGAQESANSFNNALSNGNGIMQVTCSSGRKGYTEFQELCDVTAPPPDYIATRRSIEFNVEDAMLVLQDNYREVVENPNYGQFIYYSGLPSQVDRLTTAVVRYNAGPFFLDQYRGPQHDEKGYLGGVARKLRPDSPDRLSIAELLADAGYSPELEPIDLLWRHLMDGQAQIDAIVP